MNSITLSEYRIGIKFDKDPLAVEQNNDITKNVIVCRCFGNDSAWNVTIFGDDNSSSSRPGNRKNNFLILRQGPTYCINGNLGSPEKKFSIHFTKANTKFCLSLCYNADNSYLFINGNKFFKFKADNKNVNFQTQFCLRGISNGFSATDAKEVSLNGSVYNISVDYNSIDKSDISNIHKYLMTKNNIK